MPFFDGTNIEETFDFFIKCNNLDIASIASNLTAMYCTGSSEAMSPMTIPSHGTCLWNAADE